MPSYSLCVNEDGMFYRYIEHEGTLTFKDRTADIEMVNRLRWQNQTIVYTPTFGKTTANTVVGADIVVRGVELPLRPNNIHRYNRENSEQFKECRDTEDGDLGTRIKLILLMVQQWGQHKF